MATKLGSGGEGYDVVVVGGGPGGLSAALWLGRSRRRTLLVDAGVGRNAASRGLHGLLTRDGMAPAELRALGREELERYEVESRDDFVAALRREKEGFELELASGDRLASRAVILATGVRDRLPQIPGLEERYGTSVHHCPYCDAWEHRDQPLAVYGRERAGFALARKLTSWSKDVVLCTDGASGLRAGERSELAQLGIAVERRRVAGLEGEGPALERIRFADGSALERSALFFTLGWEQASRLAFELACRSTRKGCVATDDRGRTEVPGLYVIGDASRDVQLVVVAAAEGAKAAIHLHEQLLEGDLKLRASARDGG
jgi:thioredoxin reductase